ncbi:hypothetical protein ACOMHN_005396 [Nucella lapillus]
MIKADTASEKINTDDNCKEPKDTCQAVMSNTHHGSLSGGVAMVAKPVITELSMTTSTYLHASQFSGT